MGRPVRNRPPRRPRKLPAPLAGEATWPATAMDEIYDARDRRGRKRESAMFTFTGAASEAIDQLTAAENVGEKGGLRLSLNGSPEDGAVFSVDVNARPAPGDDVIDVAGTQVFLAREVRVQLAAKVLDARKDIDGHFTFLVTSPE
ncbi:hypothetical protein [Amycolatopsis sp. NPDC054798]